MRISSVEITDVLGTKHVTFPPGTVTVISGANGTGKSSITKALAKLFEGGHDASLIRKGAKKGRVRAELDTGAIIDLTITPSGTTLEILDANGMVVPSPRKFMESLGGSMAVDPGKLLAIDTTTAAGKKALMAAILAAMPVSFAPEDLPEPARGLMSGPTANLEDLAKIRKGIEETRRRIGVEVRDADGTIRSLRKSLADEGDGTDWPAKANMLASELAAAERVLADEIAAIRQEAQTEKDKLAEEHRKALAEVDSVLSAAIQDTQAEMKAEHDRLTIELATARERASQMERMKGAKQTIAKLEEAWADKSQEYDRLTAVLEGVDTARKSKLANLPVESVEFDGDSVLVDGVEWQNANTAKRVSVALQLCGLRAGELPFLILDDSEHLDAETWQQIRTAAAESGFQLVAARVNESGPLKIETETPEALVR